MAQAPLHAAESIFSGRRGNGLPLHWAHSGPEQLVGSECGGLYTMVLLKSPDDVLQHLALRTDNNTELPTVLPSAERTALGLKLS